MSALSPQWIEKFPFDAKHLQLVGPGLLAISGGTSGMALYDLASRSLRWFHKRQYFWDRRGGAIRHGDTLWLAGDQHVHQIDVHTGELEGRIHLQGYPNANLLSPVLVDDVLYIINGSGVVGIDLVKRKKTLAYRFAAKLLDEDRQQSRAVWLDGRIWAVTRKGKQCFLEGVGEAGPIKHELPKKVELAAGPVALGRALYFAATSGRFYGIDVDSGKIVLDVDLFAGVEEEDPTRRFVCPVVHQGKLALWATVLNARTCFFVIDPVKKVIDPETIDLEGYSYGGDVETFVSRPDGLYGLGRADLYKLRDGQIVEWIKFDEQRFWSWEDTLAFDDDGHVYACFQFKDLHADRVPALPTGVIKAFEEPGYRERDEDDDDDPYDFHNGLCCLGGERADASIGKAVNLVEQEARKAYHAADTDGAAAQVLPVLDQVIAIYPHPPALGHRGWKKAELGDLAGALADAEQSIAGDPTRDNPYLLVAHCKSVQGDTAAQAAAYAKAIELGTRESGAYVNYAERMLLDGQPALALAALDKLLDFRHLDDEDAAGAHYLRALAQYDLGQAPELAPLETLLAHGVTLGEWDYGPLAAHGPPEARALTARLAGGTATAELAPEQPIEVEDLRYDDAQEDVVLATDPAGHQVGVVLGDGDVVLAVAEHGTITRPEGLTGQLLDAKGKKTRRQPAVLAMNGRKLGIVHALSVRQACAAELLEAMRGNSVTVMELMKLSSAHERSRCRVMHVADHARVYQLKRGDGGTCFVATDAHNQVKTVVSGDRRIKTQWQVVASYDGQRYLWGKERQPAGTRVVIARAVKKPGEPVLRQFGDKVTFEVVECLEPRDARVPSLVLAE